MNTDKNFGLLCRHEIKSPFMPILLLMMSKTRMKGHIEQEDSSIDIMETYMLASCKYFSFK